MAGRIRRRMKGNGAATDGEEKEVRKERYGRRNEEKKGGRKKGNKKEVRNKWRKRGIYLK